MLLYYYQFFLKTNKQADKTTNTFPLPCFFFLQFKNAQVFSVLGKPWFDGDVPFNLPLYSYLLFNTVSLLFAISLTLQNLALQQLYLHSTETSRSPVTQAHSSQRSAILRDVEISPSLSLYFLVLLLLWFFIQFLLPQLCPDGGYCPRSCPQTSVSHNLHSHWVILSTNIFI